MKDYNQNTTKQENSFQSMLISIQDLGKSLPGKEKTKEMLVDKYSKK